MVEDEVECGFEKGEVMVHERIIPWLGVFWVWRGEVGYRLQVMKGVGEVVVLERL